MDQYNLLMTPKYPFDPDGMKDKIAQIYALSDTALAVQAGLVKADLVAWVNDNFTLTTDQATYLSNIDNKWIDYNADQMSFCFLYRVPVILIQPVPVPGLDKLFVSKPALEVTANSDGTITVTGEYIFRAYYR